MKQKILIFSLLILVLSSSVFALSWDQWLAKWGEVFIGPSEVSITGYATATPSCTDSDGGINYYVKGTVRYFDGAGYYNYSDYCFSSTGLYERYCSGNYVYGTTYYCPYGCSDGACVNVTPPTPSCTIKGDINRNGVVDRSDAESILKMAIGLASIDSCADMNYDGKVDISDVILAMRSSNYQLSCAAGQKIGDVNNDGVINQLDVNLTAMVAIGQIAKPSNLCCIDLNNDGIVDIFDVIKVLRIAQGLDSSPGVCGINATATPACTDSDGGINYYVKGTVRYFDGRTYYNYSDYCFSSTGLYERYCSGNYVYGTTYTCPYGCSDGACINATSLTCMNIYSKDKHTDYCVSSRCAPDRYLRCENKTEGFLFWTTTYYYEVCAKTYSTGCATNPQCNAGDILINRTAC